MGSFQKSDSMDSIALVVEILFGLFGLLGIGWFYAGNMGIGALAFFGYFVLIGLESVVVVVTGGLAACLIVPVNLALIVVSGFKARDYVRNTGARGNILFPLIALGIAFLFACGLIVLLTVMGAAIGEIFSEITRELQVTPVP